MSEACLKSFVHNGKLYDTTEFDNIYKESHPSIYEVIRIIDGVPLFLEEHYERLINSSKLMGGSIYTTIKEMKNFILNMIQINKVQNYNIKIVINGLNSKEYNIYYFFITSHYPDPEMYQNGVDTILFSAVRNNPNAKVLNQSLRDEINKLLKNENVYEALLVNNHGEVTEGSRSNLFFIKNDEVFTAPEKDVLSGITRNRIITLCKKNGIEVIETPIKTDILSTFEAAFISGTSPKVLPIRLINSKNLDVSNSKLKKIMMAYNEEIENYLKYFK